MCRKTSNSATVWPLKPMVEVKVLRHLPKVLASHMSSLDFRAEFIGQTLERGVLCGGVAWAYNVGLGKRRIEERDQGEANSGTWRAERSEGGTADSRHAC